MKRLLYLGLCLVILISCNKEVAKTVTDSKTENKAVTSKTNPENNTKPVKQPQEVQKTRAELSTQQSNVKTLEKSVQPISPSYKVYYQSGKDKHNSGDFAGAIADFSKAIELNPQFGEGYGFRGLSKFKSGNSEGACSDWEKAGQLGYQNAQNMISNYCK